MIDPLPLAVLVPLPETPMVGDEVELPVEAAVPDAVSDGLGSTDRVTERVPVRVPLMEIDALMLPLAVGVRGGVPVLEREGVLDGVLEGVRVGVRVGDTHTGGCPPEELPYTLRETVALSQKSSAPEEMTTCRRQIQYGCRAVRRYSERTGVIRSSRLPQLARDVISCTAGERKPTVAPHNVAQRTSTCSILSCVDTSVV